MPEPIIRWQFLCFFLRSTAYSQAHARFEPKPHLGRLSTMYPPSREWIDMPIYHLKRVRITEPSIFPFKLGGKRWDKMIMRIKIQNYLNFFFHNFTFNNKAIIIIFYILSSLYIFIYIYIYSLSQRIKNINIFFYLSTFLSSQNINVKL